MSRAYNVIDADGHILEPLDLWAKYMDPKFRDRAPRLVTDNETGKEKLLVEQQMLGSEQGMGGIGGGGGRQGAVKAASTRTIESRTWTSMGSTRHSCIRAWGSLPGRCMTRRSPVRCAAPTTA